MGEFADQFLAGGMQGQKITRLPWRLKDGVEIDHLDEVLRVATRVIPRFESRFDRPRTVELLAAVCEDGEQNGEPADGAEVVWRIASPPLTVRGVFHEGQSWSEDDWVEVVGVEPA